MRRNPTSILARLRASASPALAAWIDQNEPAVLAKIERAKRRAAFSVHKGEGTAARPAGERMPALSKTVDLAASLQALTKVESRDVLTSTSGGVPIASIVMDYTETGYLPENLHFRNIKDAEAALNWLNRAVKLKEGGLGGAYRKTVISVTWRDGAKWSARFDVDGTWQTHDLFGRENTGGGITWENTTDKGKIYERTANLAAPAWKEPFKGAASIAPKLKGKFGGSTIAPGTWLYQQLPGSTGRDAVLLVVHHAGEQFGGYWDAKRHGGITPYRIEDSRLHDLAGPLVPGNYGRQLGYLEQVIPDAGHRARFVEHARKVPAREAAAKKAEEETKSKAEREIGPWFADVVGNVSHAMGVKAGGRGLTDVGAGWVLKKVLKRHGIVVKTGQRHYSMASGMDFSYQPADKAKINAIFPWLAGAGNGIHPFAHEDRSDSQSDYYSPGGFRVAPKYRSEVEAAIGAETAKEQASAAEKAAKAPEAQGKVWQSDYRAGDVLVMPGGSADSNVVDVYLVGGMVANKAGRLQPDLKHVATSQVYRRQRSFYNLVTKGGKDDAPDFTFRKLVSHGGGVILRKYMPELTGHRVLARGSGWYADAPSGEKYQNYAYDVT